MPGIIFLEIDGLALPVLQRAMRDGSAPTMARWIADHGYHLAEWETDLSSQTGASQAGILLGSNEDIPRVPLGREGDRDDDGLLLGRGLRRDRAPALDRRRPAAPTAAPAAATCSPARPRTRSSPSAGWTPRSSANPGYRAFLANGFNVTRLLVLYLWEVVLEWTAAARQKRRDVRPRGHRGGIYPFLRAAMCVFIRDLIVYSVLTDMMRGRPAVYATFASYDEVAHHSGLERADTLEALRKLDQQFARIERARRYAPRPYEIVVLSDHGQTQGATFKQRHGYGLDELVERSLSQRPASPPSRAATSSRRSSATPSTRRPARTTRSAKNDVSGRDVVVLGSGNLGLDLPDGVRPQRLTLEEIQERHPDLIARAARRTSTSAGCSCAPASTARSCSARTAAHYLDETARRGRGSARAVLAHRGRCTCCRTDGFAHVADIMVGSFYDPELDEGCAFEELICFHGGLGGPQTRPFILYPPTLTLPPGPIIGAAAVHGVLRGWRTRAAAPTPRLSAPRRRSPAPAR